jgi:antitoxin (DNA-binding transcriptional repressor) of toxin-antitoxin stability system
MPTITLEEAQARLPELIASLQPGSEVAIVRDGEPLATLTRSLRTSWPCQAGSAKDTPHWMAPAFDAPQDDFREYME